MADAVVSVELVAPMEPIPSFESELLPIPESPDDPMPPPILLAALSIAMDVVLGLALRLRLCDAAALRAIKALAEGVVLGTGLVEAVVDGEGILDGDGLALGILDGDGLVLGILDGDEVELGRGGGSRDGDGVLVPALPICIELLLLLSEAPPFPPAASTSTSGPRGDVAFVSLANAADV